MNSPSASTARLATRSEVRNRTLRKAQIENYNLESSTSPSMMMVSSPPSAPSSFGGSALSSLTAVSGMLPPTSSISGSPDQRRVQKLESGVLDLSVRELENKDLQGVAQLIDVCSVHSLCLAHNHFTSLPVTLPTSLVYLDLSHNQMESLNSRGLDCLVNLRTLLASHNQLTTMLGLDRCLLLETLDLSHNEIVEAEPLPAHRSLYELNLAYNRVDDVDNLRTMALSHMQVLHLRGNPLALPGSNYRNVVCHMMPSVRVLDGDMQAPSPYVHLDEVSDSPARRDEARDRATGQMRGDSQESRGRAHWAKKPNVVPKTRKKHLTYATIHAKKIAAASANNYNISNSNNNNGSSSNTMSASVSTGVGGDGSSGASNAVTTPTTRGLDNSSSGNRRSNSRRGQRTTTTTSGSRRSEKRLPSRESPNKEQISRDPPSSIAMQMTKHHIQRSTRPSSPSVVINVPAAAHEFEEQGREEDEDEEEEDSHWPPHNSRSHKKTTRRSTPTRKNHRTKNLTERQQRIAQRTRATALNKTTSSSSSSSSKKRAKQTMATKMLNTSHISSRRLSKSSSSKKYLKRPSPISTNTTTTTTTSGFGRTGSFSQNDTDKHALSQQLTPRTLAFASNLRGSGSGRRTGGVSTTSSMKKRALEQRKMRKGLRVETTELNNQVSDEQLMERLAIEEEEEGEQQAVHSGHVKGGGERNADYSRPMMHGELLDEKVERVMEDDNSTEEWNSILHELIDQKKRSLALLYQSLANESESQLRMVNSNVVGEDANKYAYNGAASHIHIDRGGRVSSRR